MEIDASNFDDHDLKKPEVAKLHKELKNKYYSYAIIEEYLE